MITVFFKSYGALLVDIFETKNTIDNKYCVDNILDPLVHTIKLVRRPQVHSNVKEYLKSEGIIILDNPQYSSDLALCDFWLFNET